MAETPSPHCVARLLARIVTIMVSTAERIVSHQYITSTRKPYINDPSFLHPLVDLAPLRTFYSPRSSHLRITFSTHRLASGVFFRSLHVGNHVFSQSSQAPPQVRNRSVSVSMPTDIDTDIPLRSLTFSLQARITSSCMLLGRVPL